MKIVIADYPNVLGRELEKEFAYLRAEIPDAEIVVHPYTDPEAFFSVMAQADGLLTAFIPLDAAALARMPKLRAVSINATGYNFIDLAAADARGIYVCAIGEYCTQEVADHALALLLALERNLKRYEALIEQRNLWQYYAAPRPMGLQERTLGVFGLGKIGRAVTKRALAFNMRVLAVDPHTDAETAAACGAQLTDEETLLAQSDIISNHMNLTPENQGYFDYARFCRMKKHPIFLNVARGGSVIQNDLVRALDEGLVRAAGLDVLEEEKPELATCPLVGRENVIITPHAAFFSERSMEALQRVSCQNLTACLTGHSDTAFRVVNNVSAK